MKRTINHYLKDIIASAELVGSFVKDQDDFEEFIKDQRTYFAVMMNIAIIGEAAGKIPAAVREQHTDIDWSKAVGMRNFLIHEYFETDPKIVWKTATVYIPELLEKIKAVPMDQN